ncbi:MAG: ribosome maturation factor RimM [Pyrinomonadaceae bacterium]
MSDDREPQGTATSQSDYTGELVAVAQAVRTRGLRGEIVADLLTDFPERFARLETLIAVNANNRQREVLRIENYWFQGARIILKFAGYDSIETATALVGCEFAVPEAERVELAEDEFYDWELIGCAVESTGGEAIGQVVSVMRTGGVEMLVVESAQDKKRDHLIPLAETICIEIDIAQKRIRVDPPEGLLEM